MADDEGFILTPVEGVTTVRAFDVLYEIELHLNNNSYNKILSKQ